MKIAFVLFSYFPYGGLQRDFLKILLACQAQGSVVSVFCMSWQGDIPANINLIIPEVKGFSRVAKIQNFVKQMMQKTAGEFDAVIGFNKMPGLDYYYAADSCYVAKAREERSWLYRQSARCKQYLAFEEAVFAQPSKTKVLYIAPDQRQQFQAYYDTKAERETELPAGISRDRKAGEDAAELRANFRKEFGLCKDDILILQVGSGFAIKGVDRSLMALAALPDAIKAKVHFYLVGQDKAAKYISLASKIGLNLPFTVFPGRDDIPTFLQGADILLHPAYQESAGLVLLESVVAGLPVLTTETCGFAFHIEKAEAGLVCPSPFKQKELNELLLRMLQPEARTKWRENGIAYGEKEDVYDMPEKVASLIMSDSVVGGSGVQS